MSIFWGLFVFGCLAWYTLTCVYITIYGAMDIKSMLARLRNGGHEDGEG